MSLFSNYSNETLEAGTDEAGRGCLAGPVVAAAVILSKSFSHSFLNDSKQLSEKQRKQLKPIIEKEALSFGVGIVSEKEIDKINILQASILAMHKSIRTLDPTPSFLIVDGNQFKPYQNIPHKTIIKGDTKFMSIAAASILAKTYRDEWMEKLHLSFPQYGWDTNKGYPTKNHRKAIEEYGITAFHRKSFRLFTKQYSLDF